MTRKGELSREYHSEWLSSRRKYEEEVQNVRFADETLVEIPSKFDILLGRGKHSREHPGNIRLASLLEQNLDKYNKAPKFVKQRIADEIVSTLQSKGGRFLKQRDNLKWEEVDDQVAVKKVSHDFRTVRRKKAKEGDDGGTKKSERADTEPSSCDDQGKRIRSR